MVKRGPHKAQTEVRFLSSAQSMVAWCSLVNMSPCQGEDHGFKSRRDRSVINRY